MVKLLTFEEILKKFQSYFCTVSRTLENHKSTHKVRGSNKNDDDDDDVKKSNVF